MRDLKSKTLAALSWSGIAQLARQSLGIVVSVILARLLNPRDFGLIGMAMVFVSFAQIFSDLGLGSALIQKVRLEQRHLDSIFWINIIVGIILTGVTFAVAPVIAFFYREPVLKPLIMSTAFIFLIGSFKETQSALLIKEMRFKELAVIETASSLIGGAVGITMVLIGFGVWSLVIQVLVFKIISVIITWKFCSWRPGLFLDLRAVKDLLGFGLNLLGFDVLNYWMRNLDNLLIGRFIGSAGLGIYSRAYNIMLWPINQLSGVISRVMFPTLSILQDNLEKVRKVYLQINRMIAFITFPLMIGVFVLAKPFVLGIFGQKWQELVPVLRILSLNGIMQSVGTTVGLIYNSQGRTDLQFKWGIFAGIIIACSFFVGLHWGIIGVATAYTLSCYLILWYPAWAIPGRLINLRFSDMARNLSGCFFCAVIMALTLWLLGNFLPQNWPNLIYLAIQMPFGAGVYFLSASLFRIKAYREIKGLIIERWNLCFTKA